VDIRSAGDRDFPSIAKIALANGDQDGADQNYVSHLCGTGRFLVAEVNGTIAGYCATRRIGDATVLCDLFIDPSRHGRGIGGRLLETALDGAGERFTFASQDPRALPLYVRHGMIPRWPLLYLSGAPTDSAPLRSQKVPVGEAAGAELELTGHDRIADYGYWSTLPGGTGLIVWEGRSIVAAGAAVPGSLLHLISGTNSDPVANLIAALGTFDLGTVRLCLPSPHPALPLLLNARWRIEDYDHHMSSSPDLLDPRHIPSASLA
jgi:GNAT superfamily N-acetyltransferase